jgi:hypothetical protein
MLMLKVFGALPATGFSAGLRKTTARKKSHRFQVARPSAADRNMDMHATIAISEYEALVGTRKVVSVPYGFKRRMFRVDVPAGMEAGKFLRLRGQGASMPGGKRGDLILKVVVQTNPTTPST